MSLHNKTGISILRVIRNVTGILFILSAAVLAAVLVHYYQMRLHNEQIRKQVVTMPAETDEIRKTAEGNQSPSGASELPVVDFKALKEINDSCVGWIYACGGAISLPVVASEDDFYLKHAIDGTRSAAGAVFVESRDEKPFAGGRAILYGHNMRDGSMFHPLLHYWQEEEYLSQHPYIYLITEEEVYQYEITSVYVAEYKELAFEALSKQSSRSVIDLITCEYSGKNTRLVVEAEKAAFCP